MINTLKTFYCQKVLPLVYDESLSYYEAICKLTNKINEIIGYIDLGFEDAIRKQLDKLFINAMYDEPNEMLILTLGVNDERS